MKAVNLLPDSARRSATGIAAYAVLGVLGLALLAVTVVTLTNRQIADKRAEVARVKAEAAASEGRKGSLERYTTFAGLRAKRVETVTSLAKSRFDWAGTMRELSRTIPDGTSLSSLRGTVAPGVAVDGGTDPLRASLPVPAIELQGCTTSQKAVARMMTAMRQISGVQRVSLSSSEKGEGNGGDSGCAAGAPVFSMTVFYKAQEGLPPATGSTAARQAPAPAAAAAAGDAASTSKSDSTASKGTTP
jgi:Tfp pilus assembly protein PilN